MAAVVVGLLASMLGKGVQPEGQSGGNGSAVGDALKSKMASSQNSPTSSAPAPSAPTPATTTTPTPAYQPLSGSLSGGKINFYGGETVNQVKANSNNKVTVIGGTTGCKTSNDSFYKNVHTAKKRV